MEFGNLRGTNLSSKGNQEWYLGKDIIIACFLFISDVDAIQIPNYNPISQLRDVISEFLFLKK